MKDIFKTTEYNLMKFTKNGKYHDAWVSDKTPEKGKDAHVNMFCNLKGKGKHVTYEEMLNEAPYKELCGRCFP